MPHIAKLEHLEELADCRKFFVCLILHESCYTLRSIQDENLELLILWVLVEASQVLDDLSQDCRRALDVNQLDCLHKFTAKSRFDVKRELRLRHDKHVRVLENGVLVHFDMTLIVDY